MAESTEELLKLSIIYQTLLNDLACIGNFEWEFPVKHQAFQLVSDAVDQAGVVKKRCAFCDSTNVVMKCDDCGYMR